MAKNGFSDPAIRAKARATQEANKRELEEFRAWKAAQAAGTSAAPQAPNHKLSRLERFNLENSDEEVTTTEQFSELTPEIAELARQHTEGGHRGHVTHTTTKEMVVFDRRGIAQRVLRSAYALKLTEPGRDGHANWFEDCPLCHGYHPQTEHDPNACPARAENPVMIVACPARADCAWEGRVFPEDEIAQGGQRKGRGEQLFPMTDDTKKAIGRSLALAHAWAKHPTESMGRGLPAANNQPQQRAAAVA